MSNIQNNHAETVVEAIYQPLKSRKRGILAAGLVVALAVGGLGGTALASLTVETLREGSNVSGEAKAGMEFTNESGVIVKNISPGEIAEDFPVTATNAGNIAGHVAIFAANLDQTALSDGFLDKTLVTITLRGHNNMSNVGTVTLREFATNAYVPIEVGANSNFTVLPGENVEYTVRLTPPTSAENFTEADLIIFDQPFTLGFRFVAVDADGQSDLSRWAVANAAVVEGGGLYSIAQSELVNVAQNGISSETIGG